MSDYLLQVPEDIYTRASELAEDTDSTVEQVLLDQLSRLSDPLQMLPADEQSELTALRVLPDEALWTVAREQLPAAVHEQMQDLMDKNSAGTISDDEYQLLESLVERGNRLMLRKAEAAVILKTRGHNLDHR